MTQLKILTLFLFVFTIMQGCKKDDAELSPRAIEEAAVLATKQYLFRGTLPDSTILWRYGVYEFQRGTGSIPLGGGQQPKRSLTFDLVSNMDYSTRISIATPSYDVISNELFTKTLLYGDKEVGGKYNKFELAITLDKKVYTTNGDQTGSILKVLKTEKSVDEFNREVVWVWFKVDCKFYSTVDTSSFSFKNGYFITGFLYNL
jgi:hypothetical protein